MSDVSVMPGEGRVVVATVCGHVFGLRKPSRGDMAEINRRLAEKLAGFGNESEILNSLDGQSRQWEARFEVLLVPQRSASGEVLALGERAPAHWLEKGPRGEDMISFRNVSLEEFEAACEAFAEVFKKKASQ